MVDGLGISYGGKEGSGEAQIFGEQPNAANTFLRNLEDIKQQYKEDKAKKDAKLRDRKKALSDYDAGAFDNPIAPLTPLLDEKRKEFAGKLRENILNDTVLENKPQLDYEYQTLVNLHKKAKAYKDQQDAISREVAMNPDKYDIDTHKEDIDFFHNQIASNPEKALSNDIFFRNTARIGNSEAIIKTYIGNDIEKLLGTEKLPTVNVGDKIYKRTEDVYGKQKSGVEYIKDEKGNYVPQFNDEKLDAIMSNPSVYGSVNSQGRELVREKVNRGELPPEALSDMNLRRALAKEYYKNRIQQESKTIITKREEKKYEGKIDDGTDSGIDKKKAPVTALNTRPSVTRIAAYTERNRVVDGKVVKVPAGTITKNIKDDFSLNIQQKDPEKPNLLTVENKGNNIISLDNSRNKTQGLGSVNFNPIKLAHAYTDKIGYLHMGKSDLGYREDYFFGHVWDVEQMMKDGVLEKDAKQTDIAQFEKKYNDTENTNFKKYKQNIAVKATPELLEIAQKSGIDVTPYMEYKLNYKPKVKAVKANMAGSRGEKELNDLFK